MSLKVTKTQARRFKRIRTLAQMRALDPVEFEKFVGWLFRQGGYRVRETVVAGDEGVDLEVRRRPSVTQNATGVRPSRARGHGWERGCQVAQEDRVKICFLAVPGELPGAGADDSPLARDSE